MLPCNRRHKKECTEIRYGKEKLRMNIPINQDIETTYRNEFVKGFSIYEFGFSFGGFVAIALVTILLWWKFGIAFNIGVYAGFPFVIPFFICGFYKPNGMLLPQYIKERRFEKKTCKLTYETDDISEEGKPFSMKSNGSLTSCMIPVKEKKKRGVQKDDKKILRRKRK